MANSTVNNSTWSGTDLSVANGGTGASSASTARGKNNLDVNQAGYLGYPTRIKILPSDLRPDDDISTSNIALRSAYYGGSASVMHSYLEAFASFQIPSGFKATSTTLYTSVNLAFAVYENAINSSVVHTKVTVLQHHQVVQAIIQILQRLIQTI